jgi:DNA-binding phage protein
MASALASSVGGLQAAEAAGGVIVVLTRDFKETVQARIARDPAYGRELLREGAECLLSGDLDTAKTMLRDYINATMGFEELSGLTKKPAKSLMRMLGPNGNPQARNLLEVIAQLQRAEGLHFEVSLKSA